MRLPLLTLACLFLLSACGKTYKTSSLDSKATATVEEIDNQIFISLSSNGKEIIAPSPIDISIDGKPVVWNITGKEKKTETVQIEMPYGGEFMEQEFTYSELSLSNKDYNTTLKVRMYPNTLAYKVEFSDLTRGAELQENSKWIPADASGRYLAPNGEQEPLDPVSFADQAKDKRHTTPVIYQSEGSSFAMHECDLRNFAQLGIKVDHQQKNFAIATEVSIAPGAEFETPWRVILFGETLADVHNQKPVYQTLNPESEGDYSWVKPGIGTWDWRVRDMVFDGFKYEVNDASLKRHIDFCAENDLEYFMLDAGWYTPNPLIAIPGLNIKEVMAYAESKGIAVILYYDRHYALKSNEKRAVVPFQIIAKHFATLGGAGIKYGFYNAQTSQQKVKDIEEIIQICAANKLLVDFHDGPIPFSGMERTYPNYINREYCHAQLDSRRAFNADSFVKMACINLLAGNMDQTNGTYMLHEMASRSKGPMNEYHSTVAAENARVFITHTGTLSMLIDAPEAYRAKYDLFSFIRALPDRWDETRYLEMESTSHVAVARRSADTWFVGVAFNTKGGDHTLKLDFLKADKQYTATIYKDAPDTDHITNMETYVIETKDVDANTVLQTKVPCSGGYTIILNEK